MLCKDVKWRLNLSSFILLCTTCGVSCVFTRLIEYLSQFWIAVDELECRGYAPVPSRGAQNSSTHPTSLLRLQSNMGLDHPLSHILHRYVHLTPRGDLSNQMLLGGPGRYKDHCVDWQRVNLWPLIRGSTFVSCRNSLISVYPWRAFLDYTTSKWALNLPSALLLELQKNKETFRCAKLGQRS